MDGFMRRVLRLVLRFGFKPVLGPPFGVTLLRICSDYLMPVAGRKAADTCCRDTVCGGMPTTATRKGASGRSPNAVLHFHGGAFVIGSPTSHKVLLSHLATATGADVFAPDYRLAPTYKHPAQKEDALEVYKDLLDKGYNSCRIAMTGDSAGGGLAVQTVQTLRDKGMPLPACVVLFSPWIDYTLTGDSMVRMARRDPFLRKSFLSMAVKHMDKAIMAGVRPLDEDMSGLPPMLIHVGTDEILYSDSVRLAENARTGGVDVRLESFEGLWHVFHLNAGMLPSATRAVADAGEFIRKHWQ